jgi:uncharacterized membrane protein YbhN (UPF0104 family)
LSTPEAGPKPEAKDSRRWRRVLAPAFSIAVFGVILWYGGLDSWAMVVSGDFRLYLWAFVLSGVVPALSAWRLRTVVVAATGAAPGPWRRFFHINMTAIALGLLLPRNAALLGTKATYLRTMGVPLVRGTSAALSENLVDLLFLGAFVIPSALVIVSGVGPTAFLLVSVACLVAMLVVALGVRGRDWRGRLLALIRKFPLVRRWLPASGGDLLPGPVRALGMLGATVLIHVAMVGRAYVIARAIGLEPSWLVFAAAYPLTQIGLALAVAPGALGTFDASWFGLLVLLGLSNADAVSFTVALRACVVIFPILWYGVSALLAHTIASDRNAGDRDGMQANPVVGP